MPFDQSVILSVSQPVYQSGQVFLSWTSTAAAGTYYQIYINAALADVTTQTSAWISAPSDGVGRVDIGAVLATEAGTDFSASLPAAPKRRASITWSGGTSLGLDLAGFRVYGESTPGGGINYASALADIGAFPGGSTAATGSYSWTSGALTSGVWSYGVRPYDAAGNEGAAMTTTVTINAPPGPPAKFATGERLRYTFIPSGVTPSVGLAWLASEFG